MPQSTPNNLTQNNPPLVHDVLICPVCDESLQLNSTFYACPNNHTFDIAKRGYINLLLAHEKNSLAPGDSKEMVQSRVAFLNQGYYLPIANALNIQVDKQFTLFPNTKKQIADIGCGVGYYLDNMKKHLELNNHTDTQYYGIDISKDAIYAASGLNKKINWIVGSAVKMPFATASLDMLITVFSPLYIQQMHRVLAPHGQMIVVTPNENHLIELRELLFDNVKAIESDKILDKTTSYFELVQETPLSYQINLQSSQDIANLLKMTPFYWRSTVEKKNQLCSLNTLSVTVSVTLRTFSSSIHI